MSCILRSLSWIHGYGLSTQWLSWWMLGLYVCCVPGMTSISSFTLHVYWSLRESQICIHILLWFVCTWRRSRAKTLHRKSWRSYFFSTHHITPDANDSTFSTGARPRSARFSDQIWSHAALTRFSYQTTRTMIQRRNKRLFGCHHLNCEGKKEMAAVRIHKFFGERQKKIKDSGWHFVCPASINFKFWNVILFFFWILTCPKTIRWCSAWRHDLKDLTPLKVQDISTSPQWSSSSDVHQLFYSSGWDVGLNNGGSESLIFGNRYSSWNVPLLHIRCFEAMALIHRPKYFSYQHSVKLRDLRMSYEFT